MTTKRLDVGVKKVNWHDGQQVTESDMDDEQTRNVDIDAATVNNFMGSGVLNHTLSDTVLINTNSLNTQQQAIFDAYAFDGQDLYVGTPLSSVSDEAEGVQISVTLASVDLDGAIETKVSIIGDEFGGDLIHDDLVFQTNGTQITRGRYKTLRSVITHNFAGNLYGSLSPARVGGDAYGALIGSMMVREAKSMEVSRDVIIASQMSQPTQFFGDFVPGNASDSISSMLQNGIGSDKPVSDLNIGFVASSARLIEPNDVSTIVGQKFLANGSNIQKVSVLMAVKEDKTVPAADAYGWSGSVTITLYALQTEVACPVSPVPDTAVDFDPDPTIIAQLSLDIDDLEKQGVVLSDGYDAYQSVDFVFTGSPISDPTRTSVTSGRYYALAIHRSGDTTVGTIVFTESPQQADNGYMIIFDGTQWINVTESDMWFAVYGDYVKMADGVAYDDGIGIEVPKLAVDSTNTEVPYVSGYHSFYTSTKDAYNNVIVERQDSFSDPVQDQRTGNQVFSRVLASPLFTLLSDAQLTTLLTTESSPIMLACARDQNPRGNPTQITGAVDTIGLVDQNELNFLHPDADLLNNGLLGSVIRPDNVSCTSEYRIIQATSLSDAYGDVTGDGTITAADYATIDGWLVKYNAYLTTLPVGFQKISLSDGYFQAQVRDGELNALSLLRADVNDDGYVGADDSQLIQNFVDRSITSFVTGSYFPRLQVLVENLVDPLLTAVDIPASCVQYDTVPFVSLTWRIEYFATWLPDNISIIDTRREMPTTFTDDIASCDGGKNNFYVPGNLVIGEIQLNPDGTHYSVDFEMNHLSLDIPVTDSNGDPTLLDGYTGLLLFDNFVAESDSGLTSSGFNAMKFADGTYVQSSDFSVGRVKIAPSIQSTASNFTSTPIEDVVGMYYDPSTSLMTLHLSNLLDDGYETRPALSTKILVSVYLKKAGFANTTGSITMAQMRTLLNI